MLLLSINELHCWLMIIISLFSSGSLLNPQRYERNGPNNFCTVRLLDNVRDSAFSASSVFRKDPEFGPHAARIDSLHDQTGIRKAWCPDKLVYNTSTEWLEIDFNSTKLIKNIFTQGRNDGNYGEFVTNYYFDYQRESGLTWYRYKDTDLKELINGNHDARNSAYKKFESPLVVKRIRIIPISQKPRKVCLRIGFYGCDFNDGVVEYQIPRGDSMILDSKSLSFDDHFYDGSKFSNITWLRGGMGKLMDNVVLINSTPAEDLQNFVVAWKKKERSMDHINLLFRFHTARQLKSVKIYNTESSSIGFHTFKSLIIDFLNDDKGVLHVTNTIEMSTPRFIRYQPVLVDLKGNVANLVSIKLFFNSDWIALNEIVFSSVEAPLHVPFVTVQPSPVVSSEVFHNVITPPTKSGYVSQNLIYYIILIPCVIVSIIIIGVGFFFCFVWMKQRQKRRYKNKFFDHRTMLFNEPYNNTRGLRTISGNNPLLYRPLTPHSYAAPIPNTAQNLGYRFVHSQFPPCPDYCSQPINSCNDYEAIDSYWPKSMSQSMSFNDHKPDHLDRQTLLTVAAPDITCINRNGPVYCSASSYSSNVYSQPDNEINLPAPDVLPLSALTPDTLTGICKIHLNNPLKGPLGSTISNFQLAPASQTWVELALSRIPEIDSNQLTLETLVTEGEIAAFLSGHIVKSGVEILVVRHKPNNLRIDSKSLFYRQCLVKLKEDFSSHPNLLSIIGHCLIGGPGDNSTPSIIYAYPSQINVVSFFKKLHLIPRMGEVSFTCSYVSQSSLLYLVKQLAGALAYLSEVGVVHKDVSARNCSIGENFHLILSDFAIGIEEFSHDYLPLRLSSFSNDANTHPAVVHLPLLWMPWEAIIMGNYSTKSDIWSFGVTFWEIFTECQTKPYSTLYNQSQELSLLIPNIIRNSMLIANNHPSSILPNSRSFDLAQIVHENPNQLNSSKQIRDIMTECWRSDPATRPSFPKLYSLLCNLIPTTRPMDECGALYQLIG